jgi:rhodanese-related sulfurtransferase
MEVIDIGLFQLENLIIARSPFVFLNLATETIEISDSKLRSYIEKAILVHPDRLTDYLGEQKILKEHPIVLVCLDSRVSRLKSQDLDRLGYTNVYVIENGIQGLLDEASLL